jgi:hypothetical protein
MKETLFNLLDRYQHLSDYAESKLGVLVAFNSAIIIGVLAIFNNQHLFIKYYFIFLILLNICSLYFGLSGIYAKQKNLHSSGKKLLSKNYFYYKYVASLNERELIENLRKDCELGPCNTQLENDLSNQIVVLANNADRKFKYFNIAIALTMTAIVTPIGLLIFIIYDNPNW